MQPPDEADLSAAQNLGASRRLTLWVSLNRPLALLVTLLFGLVLFLVWLPDFVRMFFWHALQARAVLAGMTLGFSLLTVSLLWSTCQRIRIGVNRHPAHRFPSPPSAVDLMNDDILEGKRASVLCSKVF